MAQCVNDIGGRMTYLYRQAGGTAVGIGAGESISMKGPVGWKAGKGGWGMGESVVCLLVYKVSLEGCNLDGTYTT